MPGVGRLAAIFALWGQPILFPRLGDWAVMRIAPGAESWKPGAEFPEEAVRAGFFDEQWKP